MWIRSLAFAILLGLLACSGSEAPSENSNQTQAAASFEATSPYGKDWNAPEIPWQTYENGKALASELNVPMFIVLKTDWCSVCRGYQTLFRDGAVIDATRDFVPIIVDMEEDQAGASFQEFGRYIPMTVVLGPDGEPLDTKRFGPSKSSPYAFTKNSKGALLKMMHWAERQFD